MRSFLKSSGRWLGANWFWPLVLLALPNCGFQTHGIPSGHEFDPGPTPISSAFMCDIPKVPPPDSSSCVDPTTVQGMPIEYAAIALVQGETNSLALDFSSAATAACFGLVRKIDFEGPFPYGLTVCLNCGMQKPFPYPDGDAACVAKCIDLVNARGVEPAEGAQAFCQANAHVSTNFDKTVCYDDACEEDGAPNLDFFDPRKNQEPVKWREDETLIGTKVTGKILERVAPATMFGDDNDFNASGVAAQTINHGDGWVEFEVSETSKSVVLGVSKYDGTTDLDPGLGDIDFGILLSADGKVYIRENGAQIGSDHGLYTAGERFRVHFKDNNDTTATISYGRLHDCVPIPGLNICAEEFFASQTAPSPSYPLRIDTSFKEQNAILTNVTVVYIR